MQMRDSLKAPLCQPVAQYSLLTLPLSGMNASARPELKYCSGAVRYFIHSESILLRYQDEDRGPQAEGGGDPGTNSGPEIVIRYAAENRQLSREEIYTLLRKQSIVRRQIKDLEPRLYKSGKTERAGKEKGRVCSAQILVAQRRELSTLDNRQKRHYIQRERYSRKRPSQRR